MFAPQALLENLFEKRDKALDYTTRETGPLNSDVGPRFGNLVDRFSPKISRREEPSTVQKCLSVVDDNSPKMFVLWASVFFFVKWSVRMSHGNRAHPISVDFLKWF